MLPRPCIGCGKPGKSLCDVCRAIRESRQPQPSRQSRGYNSEYDRNRRIVIERAWSHNESCCICGFGFRSKSDITAEHVIPRRAGGSNALANLGPAHKRCNYGWRRKSHPQGTDPWLSSETTPPA